MKTLLLLTLIFWQAQGICQKQKLDLGEYYYLTFPDEVCVDEPYKTAFLKLIAEEWQQYKQECWNDSTFYEYNELECEIIYGELSYLQSRWFPEYKLVVIPVNDSICKLGWYIHEPSSPAEFLDKLLEKYLP